MSGQPRVKENFRHRWAIPIFWDGSRQTKRLSTGQQFHRMLLSYHSNVLVPSIGEVVKREVESKDAKTMLTIC